jgi:hypothetical protein
MLIEGKKNGKGVIMRWQQKVIICIAIIAMFLVLAFAPKRGGNLFWGVLYFETVILYNSFILMATAGLLAIFHKRND